MKTKTIEIEGRKYEVKQLSMEEGIPLISASTGNLDIAGLIRAATKIDGQPVKEGEVSFATAMQLMPVVMELNTFAGAASGNG